MHILIIHQAFASLDEAGGTRHYELARFLTKRGHKITIVASPISYLSGKSQHNHVPLFEKQQTKDGITILRTYAYPALHKSFIHRVINFFSFMISSFFAGLFVKEVDIIWGTSPPIFQGFSAWLISALRRIPFVFEVRDLWPAFAIEVGVLRNPVLIKASLWLERFLYKRAHRLIVNSPGYIQHVIEKGAQWVELIPNGVDPNMFCCEKRIPNFWKEYGINRNYFAIYAGAHGLSNDLEIILKSAEILLRNPDIGFILLGDGKEKPELMQKARAMQLNNIFFLPPVPKQTMPELLHHADVGIAILKPLDLYKTTYPNKVFDYMAAALPVALVIDGEIRKVVESANAGVFIPPGDEKTLAKVIQHLYNHKEQARKMGKQGRQYVEEHFNRSKLAKKLALVFEDVWRMND